MADIDLGNVVCFSAHSDKSVCHRVRAIDDTRTTITTKGDHNSRADQCETTDEELTGRVMLHIPGAGHLLLIRIDILCLSMASSTALMLTSWGWGASAQYASQPSNRRGRPSSATKPPACLP